MNGFTPCRKLFSSFGGGYFAGGRSGFCGMLVLIDIFIKLSFEVIDGFINSFIKIERGTFSNHLLLFDGGADTDFCLVVFLDFHSYPDTGYLEGGVVGEERFDLGGSVAADEVGDFKMTSGSDDLHTLSFLQIYLSGGGTKSSSGTFEPLPKGNVPHKMAKCKFFRGLF